MITITTSHTRTRCYHSNVNFSFFFSSFLHLCVLCVLAFASSFKNKYHGRKWNEFMVDKEKSRICSKGCFFTLDKTIKMDFIYSSEQERLKSKKKKVFIRYFSIAEVLFTNFCRNTFIKIQLPSKLAEIPSTSQHTNKTNHYTGPIKFCLCKKKIVSYQLNEHCLDVSGGKLLFFSLGFVILFVVRRPITGLAFFK